MVDLFQFIIITSLWCVGLNISAQEGYLLWFLSSPFEAANRQYINRKNYKMIGQVRTNYLFYGIITYLGKPLITCCRCMASAHSILMALLVSDFLHIGVIQVIIAIPCVAVLNSFIIDKYYK